MPEKSLKSAITSAEAASAAYQLEKDAHLSKLVGEKGKATVEKWLAHYFASQDRYHDIEEFRFHLEATVEEYVGYFSSSYGNVANEQTRMRMGEISKEYHEMLYDGEIDPYAAESERKQKEVMGKVGAFDRISRLLKW